MYWFRNCLAISMLAGAACVTTSDAVRPAVAHFEPIERGNILARARTVLERRGYVLAVADPATGVYVTEPRTGLTGAPLRDLMTREVVQVCLAEDGRVTVNIDQETLLAEQSRWVPISDARMLAAARTRQEQLLAEILGQSKS